MTNHPNRSRVGRWISSLEGLSDEPLRRAAQIALAAIDETLSNGSELTAETPLIAAYDALQAVLAQNS